jgi:hypothetical protein
MAKVDSCLSFKFSALKDSLKKQKRLEEKEKKILQDKEKNDLKLKKMLEEKTEKENSFAGFELRKLYENNGDLSIEAVKNICAKFFLTLESLFDNNSNNRKKEKSKATVSSDQGAKSRKEDLEAA